MRAWRALLWKESREELPKVLVGLGLCAMVFALRQLPGFNVEYSQNFAQLIMTFLMIYGVVLGMDLVAGESSKGTLPFLLGKPLAAAGVLLPKYFIGVTALFIVAAGAWATAYLDIEGLAFRGYWMAYNGRIVEDVGFVHLLLICITPGLIVYSLIFLGSVVADHPVKGAAIGILMMIVFSGLSGKLPQWFPQLDQFLFFNPGIDSRGRIIRMVSDAKLYGARLGFAAVVMSASIAVAVALFRRFRGASIAWQPVIGAWLCFIVFSFLMGMFSEERPENPGPLSVLTPEEGSYLHLSVLGDKGYVATRDGMAVVNISDPAAPVEVAAARLPLWTMKRIAIIDSLAYVLGAYKVLPEDSLGIAVFSVADPLNPVFKGSKMLAKVSELNPLWSWESVGRALLLSGRQDDKLLLWSFAVDAEGFPHEADEFIVQQVVKEKDDPHRWYRSLQMHVGDRRVWIGYSTGFLAIDASDPGQLRETVRVEMGDYSENYGRAGSNGQKERPDYEYGRQVIRDSAMACGTGGF